MATKTEAIEEARRFLTNARDILKQKAGKEDGYYQDRKYVMMAGHTAYVGVLVALDSLLGQKQTRKSVEWYQTKLAPLDRKLSSRFAAVYDTLHLAMAYDGNLSAKVAKAGLEDADWIINWVEGRLGQA